MSGQNTSSAVMQQRVEPHDSLDDFPTPPWATRALIRHALYGQDLLQSTELVAADPCANRGHMVRPLREHFAQVRASDIFDYGAGFAQQDYLFPGPLPPSHWTFMNPPFRLAEAFIARSRDTACWHGTCALVRSAFVESVERYHGIFGPTPPSLIAHFAERVIMQKGVLRDPKKKYWDADKINDDGTKGGWRTPSTATAYSWLVWSKQATWEGCRTIWIPPCRDALTRDGDYPDDPSGIANL